MDLMRSRGYFDSASFDAYNFGASDWNLAAFKGKLDLANPKISLMDKGTRRRMLFVSPGQEPTSTVIRCAPTGQIFLIGQQSRDMLRGVYYRDVVSLHEALGAATINRRAPTGPSNNPGWAVSSLVESTFADYEMRSDNENQQDQVTQWGSFNITLPSDSTIQEHDTLTVGGRTFFIFEVYRDSGFAACRATDRPDDRYDIVYRSNAGSVYNTATLVAAPSYTDYNVTAQLTPFKDIETEDSATTREQLKVMIKGTWIGVTPKLQDAITYKGQKYIVTKVAQNMLQDEWHLVASV
jgi:hypothetical protein